MKTERTSSRIWFCIWSLFAAFLFETGMACYLAFQVNETKNERDYWRNQAMENARFNVAPPTQLKTK